jgi:UDP-N-acetyl-D-mannosaminuronic acid dehydrogenase
MIIKQLEAKIACGQLKVAVVGFGYIGVCIGATLAQCGATVVGIDIDERIVEEIGKGTTSTSEPGLRAIVCKMIEARRLTATASYSAIREADVVIVTVGTPLGDHFEPDTTHIEAAAQAIAPNLRKGHVVVLKSTCPPYTTERTVKPILDSSGIASSDYHLAFCPERLAEGRALQEIRTVPIIVGGVDDESTRIVSRFFALMLGVRTIEVSSACAAEMAKLADNLWIDLNVALANEIAMLCDKLEIDAVEVIDAANTLPKAKYNVNILAPSMGVGGYCLTKDPWFVRHLGKSFGLDIKTPVVSRTINDTMPHYTFDLIRRRLRGRGKSLENSKVAVLGVAFKSNTGDCRHTPTKTTIELLKNSGCDLAICDPWVSIADAAGVTPHALVPTIEDAIRNADCLAFLTGHAEFESFPIEKMARLARPGACVLDGRTLFTRDQIAAIRSYGLDYKGIGR